MKNTMKLFGTTLDQVCLFVRERFGDQSVSDESLNVSSSIAVANAAHRRGDTSRSNNILAFTAAVALSAAQMPATAQTVVVVDGGAARAESVSREALTAKSPNNTAARVVGGVAGAAVGNSLTKGSGTAGKVVAVLGLGYLGQAIGDILTSNATDQHGNPIVKSVDSQGNQTYRAVSKPVALAEDVQDVRPGTERNPTRISWEVYEQAIALASAERPLRTSRNDGARTLDPQTHAGLYALIVETAASRSVAKFANEDLDAKELARAVAPGDAQKKANFSLANRTYAQTYKAYDTSYRQAVQALAIAERNGFDVSSQRLLMGVIPPDIRRTTGAPIHWPGVDARIGELDSQVNEDREVSFRDISLLAQRDSSRTRQRE